MGEELGGGGSGWDGSERTNTLIPRWKRNLMVAATAKIAAAATTMVHAVAFGEMVLPKKVAPMTGRDA